MTGSRSYITDKQALLTRLRRVEGKVRGLQRQVEDDTYCVETLTQLAAATRALGSVALMLLDQHLEQCMTHAADPRERRQKIREASHAIARLVHS